MKIIFIKKGHLRKYYHQDCSLNNLKLIYDVRQESLENYEIEQTLLKVCLKEGYAILHDFIESNQYSKYLQYQDLDISSPISFYYHLNSTNKILQNIIQLIEKDSLAILLYCYKFYFLITFKILFSFFNNFFS